MLPPLYAARVEHLIEGSSVTVFCRCGHEAEVSVSAITATLPSWYRVTEIYRVMRCTSCKRKGFCDVRALRGLGWPRD